MTRFRRPLVAAACGLLLALASTGTAAATHGSGAATVIPTTQDVAAAEDLPTDLAAAIADARAAFRSTAIAARLALRTALKGAPKPVEVATARAAARATLQTARTTYLATVSAVVAQYDPAPTLPRAALEPAWWTGTDAEWLAS